MPHENNTPAIRFAGFTGEWERRKLGEICDEFKSGDFIPASEISKLGTYPVFGGNGLRGFTQRHNHSGEYAIIGRQGALCGNVNYSTGQAYFTEHAIAVRANRNNETRFIFYLLKLLNLGQYSAQSAQPGLAVNKIIALQALLPSKAEQTKVAAILSILDTLITLHLRKCELLETLKKSMLEKLFPKEGELVPELRFAGFTGEWERRKFSDIFAFLQNNTLSRAELSESGDGAKNIHYGDILVRLGECVNVSIEPLPVITDKKIINKYCSSHLQNGDVVIADTAEDETVGKCSEITGVNEGTIISGLHTIPCRPTKSYSEGFLGHYMNSSAYHDQLIPLMQGIKVTSISKSSLQTTEVKYPKDSAEQSSVGSFFIKLDTILTLHRRTLELLEETAKAVQLGSLCGLGKTAPNPVLSTLRYFRDEYEAHVFRKTCPAGECKALARPEILASKCKGCTACAKKCPVGAISGKVREVHVIDADKCIKCGACKAACRFGAIIGL